MHGTQSKPSSVSSFKISNPTHTQIASMEEKLKELEGDRSELDKFQVIIAYSAGREGALLLALLACCVCFCLASKSSRYS